MPETATAAACQLPLPGATVRPEQAKAMLDLWGRLAAVKGHRAWGAICQQQELIRLALQDTVRGVTDPDTLRRYKARHAAAGILQGVLATLGGMAGESAAVVAEQERRVAQAKLAAERGEAVPAQGTVPFYPSEDGATKDRNTAIALDELVTLPGWRDLSLFLCAAAWVFDQMIIYGAPGEEVFYQEARARIVDMLTTDVQAAIDRGIGASAWLSAMAERDKE